MRSRFLLVPLAAVALVIGCAPTPEPTAKVPETPPAGASAPAETEMKAATYATVQAMFDQSCVKCHGEKKAEGLDLRSFEAMMAGGEHGPVIVPGDPAGSKLIKSLRGDGVKQMPMKSAPWSEDQIKVVEEWIKAGASPS